MNDKWEDCLYCVCLKCKQQFGTDPKECEHSDCRWCESEKGTYYTKCSELIEKRKGIK